MVNPSCSIYTMRNSSLKPPIDHAWYLWLDEVQDRKGRTTLDEIWPRQRVFLFCSLHQMAICTLSKRKQRVVVFPLRACTGCFVKKSSETLKIQLRLQNIQGEVAYG